MKKEEVPQDDDRLLEGKFKKLMYAMDDSDHYTEVGSTGWEAENVVLGQAWEQINVRVAEARDKVLAGKASVLLYYKEKNMMDTTLLAGYVGLPAILVSLHMRPFFYKRLSAVTLAKYADAFRITVADMQDMDRIKENK